MESGIVLLVLNLPVIARLVLVTGLSKKFLSIAERV